MDQKDVRLTAPSSGGVLRAAGVMGIATFFSRILGLVREQVFAVLFGAGVATDAFTIAFRIPNLLRDLFAEGALSSALVPTFSKVRAEQGERRAWRLAGLVFRILFVVVGVLSLVGIFWTPELVRLYAGAYQDVPGKFELTVFLTRVLFPFFPLVALAAAFMAVLNSCGKFFIPAFSSALFNLTSIVTGVGFVFALRFWGGSSVDDETGFTFPWFSPIFGMALGVLLGGLVQAGCQVPLLRGQGYRWQKRRPEDSVWYRDEGVRRVFLLMVPGMVGLAATQINVLINSFLATSQGTGAVSWLNYAFRLMQFPIGVFGVSLASATLASFSRSWAGRQWSEGVDTLHRSILQVIAINLPASLGLAFLSVPIVRLLFEYGNFSAFDTEQTARALVGYSVGLVAYSSVKVLVPICYAVGASRMAVLSSVLSVLMTIVLNLILVGPLGFYGLALGTSGAAIFNFAFLSWQLNRKFRSEHQLALPLAEWCRKFMVYTLVAVSMGFLALGVHEGLGRLGWETAVRGEFGVGGVVGLRLVFVGLSVGVAVGFLGLSFRFLGLKEGGEVFHLFFSKLQKKLKTRRKSDTI